ncbi:MAG: ABC transporter substrate-binding protein [Chromatiales bacterium]|nr:ABC transporter substrate-binding protein [Chromatiales bacterium]
MRNLALSLACLAFTAPAGATGGDPTAVLQDGIDRLTSFVRGGGAQNREAAMRFLDQEIAPSFDFEYMADWALGPMGRQMPPEAVSSVVQVIEGHLLSTLAQALVGYRDAQVRLSEPRLRGDKESVVRAWIIRPNAIPMSVDFRFYRGDSGWKIFDVVASGTSALVYYRGMLRRQMRMSQQTYGYR